NATFLNGVFQNVESVALFFENGDPCEQFLCTCDKDAIECFGNAHINSSLNGLDVSSCPSLVTETTSKRELTTLHTGEFFRHGTEKTEAVTSSVEEEEDRFTEAEVPAGEITTSPGSFQADINSAEENETLFGLYLLFILGAASLIAAVWSKLRSLDALQREVQDLKFYALTTCQNVGIGWSMCEKLLCACDQTAAECMASAFYNESLKFPHGQVCQEEKASCRGGPYGRPSVGTEPEAGTSSSEESSEEEGSQQRRGKREMRQTLGNARSGKHGGR
ncbi:UNVERIFIED_CONTAM: hypothetical protein H355_010152, partial [Colinus virginianus]